MDQKLRFQQVTHLGGSTSSALLSVRHERSPLRTVLTGLLAYNVNASVCAQQLLWLVDRTQAGVQVWVAFRSGYILDYSHLGDRVSGRGYPTRVAAVCTTSQVKWAHLGSCLALQVRACQEIPPQMRFSAGN